MKNPFYILTIPVLLIFIFSPPTQTVMLTKSNYSAKGWIKEQINKKPTPTNPNATETLTTTSYVDIVCDPANRTQLQGAILFKLPVSDDTMLRRIRFRTGKHSGTLLSAITPHFSSAAMLSYDTYVVHNQNHSNIDLVLQIDNNNDGVLDCNIAYSPTVQYGLNQPNDEVPDMPQVMQNTWQQWDASSGWWQVGLQFDNALHESFVNPKFFTLKEYVTMYPDARILDSNGGPSIRFTIGGNNTDHDNFIGYLNAFTINAPRSQGSANNANNAARQRFINYLAKAQGRCPV